MSEAKHWKMFEVTADAVAHVLRGTGIVQLTTDVPKDAKLVRCGYTADTDSFYFVMEHESFPAHHEGDTLLRIRAEVHSFTFPSVLFMPDAWDHLPTHLRATANRLQESCHRSGDQSLLEDAGCLQDAAGALDRRRELLKGSA